MLLPGQCIFSKEYLQWQPTYFCIVNNVGFVVTPTNEPQTLQPESKNKKGVFLCSQWFAQLSEVNGMKANVSVELSYSKML